MSDYHDELDFSDIQDFVVLDAEVIELGSINPMAEVEGGLPLRPHLGLRVVAKGEELIRILFTPDAVQKISEYLREHPEVS